LGRLPGLLVSDRAAAPLAVGIGGPAVVLPSRLIGKISDAQMRDVLVHEVAHLWRRDPLIVLLQRLAGALYWPIVPVHGLNRALQGAREELCDNVVLAERDAVTYGETLLRVAELSLRARPAAMAVGMLHWKGNLERRIAGLIDPRRSKSTRAGRGAKSLVLGAFLMLAAAASALIVTQQPSGTLAQADGSRTSFSLTASKPVTITDTLPVSAQTGGSLPSHYVLQPRPVSNEQPLSF